MHTSVWLTSLLPIAAAFVGVVVGNRASARREQVGRLWERRTETYLDLLTWARQTSRAVETDEGETRYLQREEYKKLQIPDPLLAKVWAFASGPVLYGHGPCENALFILSHDHDSDDDDELHRLLGHGLYDLRKAIRRELSAGTLRVPLAFRWREASFPIRRRARMFRARRRRMSGAQGAP